MSPLVSPIVDTVRPSPGRYAISPMSASRRSRRRAWRSERSAIAASFASGTSSSRWLHNAVWSITARSTRQSPALSRGRACEARRRTSRAAADTSAYGARIRRTFDCDPKAPPGLDTVGSSRGRRGGPLERKTVLCVAPGAAETRWAGQEPRAFRGVRTPRVAVSRADAKLAPAGVRDRTRGSGQWTNPPLTRRGGPSVSDAHNPRPVTTRQPTL